MHVMAFHSPFCFLIWTATERLREVDTSPRASVVQDAFKPPTLAFANPQTTRKRSRKGSPSPRLQEEGLVSPRHRPRELGGTGRRVGGGWRGAESRMEAGVGSGTRVGDGHCGTSPGAVPSCPRRAGLALGAAGWQLGPACSRKDTYTHSGT